jgi:DNA polymerase-3 subunit delta
MNYLIAGPETYLRNRFIEKIKESVLRGKKTEFNFESFRAGAADIKQILDSASTLPLYTKEKIVVVKDCEKFSSGEKASILKYLKNPVKSTVLLLLSSVSGYNKFLSDISKHAKLIPCDKLRHSELIHWIRKEAAECKKRISPQAANLLTERIGSYLSYLKNEIEKLAAFSGKKPEITEGLIEEVSGRVPHESAFLLVDLIIKKKPKAVFGALEGLLSKEKPHQILSILAWQFRNYMRVKELPSNLPVETVSRRLGMSYGIAKKTRDHARNISLADLKRNLEILLEGDLFIKRGTLTPQDALERVLVKLL